MNYAVAINSSGQATIPKAVREVLNVEPRENRVVFVVRGNEVLLKREKSRKEIFLESLAKIDKMRKEDERKHPESKVLRDKYAGMTFSEVRDAYDATPEGKAELKEKYGVEI